MKTAGRVCGNCKLWKGYCSLEMCAAIWRCEGRCDTVDMTCPDCPTIRCGRDVRACERACAAWEAADA